VPGWQTGTRVLCLYSQSPQACKSVRREPTSLTTALMEWNALHTILALVLWQILCLWGLLRIAQHYTNMGRNRSRLFGGRDWSSQLSFWEVIWNLFRHHCLSHWHTFFKVQNITQAQTSHDISSMTNFSDSPGSLLHSVSINKIIPGIIDVAVVINGYHHVRRGDGGAFNLLGLSDSAFFSITILKSKQSRLLIIS